MRLRPSQAVTHRCEDLADGLKLVRESVPIGFDRLGDVSAIAQPVFVSLPDPDPIGDPEGRQPLPPFLEKGCRLLGLMFKISDVMRPGCGFLVWLGGRLFCPASGWIRR